MKEWTKEIIWGRIISDVGISWSRQGDPWRSLWISSREDEFTEIRWLFRVKVEGFGRLYRAFSTMAIYNYNHTIMGSHWSCLSEGVVFVQSLSCVWLCNSMNCSTQGFPVLHHLACSNSSPSSQWCHPNTSSSVVPFSSCVQSFPASGSFLMSQLFASGGQSIGTSAALSYSQ